MNSERWAAIDFKALATAVGQGEVDCHILAHRPRRITARTNTIAGDVIVKLWDLRDARGMMRRGLRRTKGRSEWLSLQALGQAGLPVPRALSYTLIRETRYQEALIIEDLSPCDTLHRHMHTLSKSGKTQDVHRLEDQILSITSGMIRANLLDNDHRLGNFVVRPDGLVFRLDFENIRAGLTGRRREDALGVMIGSLVSSHVWVTRFAQEHSRLFVTRLLNELRPSSRAVARARRAAAAEIRQLQDRSGFTLLSELGW